MRVTITRRRAKHTALGTIVAVLICVPWALFALGHAVYEAIQARRSRKPR